MDVREQATRFRAEIERIKATGGKAHFPLALRRSVVAWYQARHAEGQSPPSLCRELGLSSTTLRRWIATVAVDAPREAAREAAPSFIARTLPAPAPPPPRPAGALASPLHVVGPHGLRIEGLDVATLAELLRRLA